MFLLCKVLIKRRDPFSENLCISDSTSNKGNIYEQKIKVNYSSTVSALITVVFTVLNTYVHCDKKSLDLNFGTYLSPVLQNEVML